MNSPLIPMGAMTGRPDAARMRQVLESYRNVGINQFMIYPRSGMEYEYMSEEWMQICEDTVKIADGLGMNIWLYDEYNWPSGNCRGQVTLGHEEYYPHAITFEKQAGEVTVRLLQNRVGADILNPDSVARFIQLTHQRYYDRLGPYFGRVIKGIFTDEPSFAYYTRGISPASPETKPEDFLALPWYQGMEEDYHGIRGRSFREDVSASLLGETPEYLWEDYYTLLGDRMRRVFIGAMDDWCQAHGIVQTGHLMSEDAPTSVFFNGNPLRMLSRFSQPGMDDITTHMVLDGTAMQLSALSLVQYASRDKAGALAELFALGPVHLPMAYMRQMIWLAACFGVNHYVLAVAALDARGNIEKGQYYFPTSQTAPWFPCYKELEKEAEAAAQTARKAYLPTVRLRFPGRLFMRHAREKDSPQGRLFRRFLEQAVSFQIQYLYLDENEQSDLPVLAMDENGLYIEGETVRFLDAEAFAEHVRRAAEEPLLAYDEQGRECRDVLVRRWADNTLTVISLSKDDNSERTVTLRCGEKEARIRLASHGVWNGDLRNAVSCPENAEEETANLTQLTKRLEQPNLLRCLMTKAEPRFCFKLSQPLCGVKIIVRKMARPVEIALDGQPVPAEKPAEGLPDGFMQLYAATEAITLTAGAHEITLLNGETDYRFLPAAFLQGMFQTDGQGCLLPFREDAAIGPLKEIPNYAGGCVLEGKGNVPVSPGLRLRVNSNYLCTELSLNGVSLGWRCWPPFEWEIPKEFQGHPCDLRFRILPSLMPMFGEMEKLEAEQPISSWAKTRQENFIQMGLMSAPTWMKQTEGETRHGR